LQILHFSDVHDNQRAIKAVIRIAEKWKEAFVVVTGDVCNGPLQVASSEFNELSNPGVWFVRGNHDEDPLTQFGHLPRVKWQTPYLIDLQGCLLIGLDSERSDDILIQLMEIMPKLIEIMRKEYSRQRVLIFLHHRPFSSSIKQTIISWAREWFKDVVSIALLHGHEHHPRGFYADIIEEDYDSIHIIISNVYSANMNGNRELSQNVAGCANLLEIEPSGEISVVTVFDPL